jgi:hypothetical protein
MSRQNTSESDEASLPPDGKSTLEQATLDLHKLISTLAPANLAAEDRERLHVLLRSLRALARTTC